VENVIVSAATYHIAEGFFTDLIALSECEKCCSSCCVFGICRVYVIC